MSKENVAIDCAFCGSDRTFKSNEGIWHCHNCGGHDVQAMPDDQPPSDDADYPLIKEFNDYPDDDDYDPWGG
ncbi:hypothetical protein NSS79_25890 [Paenibacillus sp. FSL L8-0436]|uniref:hypothetical protein n=1 Tax=Paenibacillus sp. FSL L8-0436 TaxID=2954686 RepID=UPI00315802FF